MKNKIIYLVLGVLVIIVLVLLSCGCWGWSSKTQSIASFQDCVDAGLPVMESDPRQCKTPDGRVFAEEIMPEIIYNNTSSDKIKVELPYPGAVVAKEFKIIGEAAGFYFEGSFPVEILDKDGKVLVSHYATAQGEWMTSDLVPFVADIKIEGDYIGPATLVLHKDNPSDMRQYDASISFPITIEY